MNRAYKKYLREEVKLNHPLKNTLLLYDKAIVLMKEAEKDFDNFKFKEGDFKFDRTQKIIVELLSQYDPKSTPEVAETLIPLYKWIYERIDFMRMTRTNKEVQGLIENIVNLRDAFKEVLKQHGEN